MINNVYNVGILHATEQNWLDYISFALREVASMGRGKLYVTQELLFIAAFALLTTIAACAILLPAIAMLGQFVCRNLLSPFLELIEHRLLLILLIADLLFGSVYTYWSGPV